MTKIESAWIDWIIELQALAQAGLQYSKDIYNIERFKRVREIAAEMMSKKSDLPLDVVRDLFCNESGYQTPKMSTRAAIFQNNKILLVREKEGWSLPGGWIDVNESVRSNTIKEVKEEAGLDVMPLRLIAVQDRNKHNHPRYAYGLCKVFVLCDIISGEFQANSETSESKFFAFDELPKLASEKNTVEQIHMCFDAHNNTEWVVQFD